ncbi:MAG: inositol monophosphatase family protein, partial [Acidimicrobiales bacterium]
MTGAGPASPGDLALALALADRADQLTMAAFRRADLAVETKPDLTPVTEADRGVERILRDLLADRRPGDAVVGEEYGASGHAGASRRWIMDPIDGTKNFVRGIPVWATLLALEEDGRMAVGVASAPALGRRWWAGRGLGARAGAPGGA